ncbi:MAG TPA: gamma-glutamyltransferase, partial [Pirellulaceae bacterium]|nr:gamma-glutamyltransferase [Pirellulaceae bacterium]
ADAARGEGAEPTSRTGPLAAAVPGALAAYERALELAGSKSLAETLGPAISLARDGFEVDASLAAALRSEAPVLATFPGSAAVLLHPDGSPYAQGERLVQADLARTLQGIAAEGSDWFYRGPFARTVDAWMREQGGLMTAADLAAYRPVDRTPIETTYRGYRIVGFPPPSSGGVHVAQILGMLERFDLARLYREDRAAADHVVIEAMKSAFADRAHWLGDPDFADVPLGLLDPDYLAERSSRIDPTRSTPVLAHGTPPAVDGPFFERHTTHIAAADARGNWVAITATINTTFGSKVIVPGTGIVLNNEMDDFAVAPGVPNAFGLIGADANAVEPGKRPLSSMSPTIVLDGDRPRLAIGAAGGPKIITQVLWGLIGTIDRQLDPAEALAEPRLHHQWSPDRLAIERGYDPELAAALERRGHRIEWSRSAGVSQAVAWDPAENVLIGVRDPRVPGDARGWNRPD